MMLLDEVTQDVALRRGAGGYVQFNQRSGGIGITEHTETISIEILGQAVATNSSTATTGNWTKPTEAYNDGGQYAYTKKGDMQPCLQSYHGYGFNIPAAANCSKVRIRLDASTRGDEKIKLYVSTDRGSTWLTDTWESPALNSSETMYWVDVTAWTGWTPTKINNDNIWARVERVVVGADASETRLDWIPIEVTYLPPVGTIYDSALAHPDQPLISMVYRGGSRVSGSDLTLRGNNSLIVNMTNALSFLRVETGQGIQIKLDYYRVRIVEMGESLGGGELQNYIGITFLRLVRGNMGGSGTVNVKVQNTEINTTAYVYSGDFTIQVKLGNDTKKLPLYPEANKTVVMFTEILVQFSTA